MTRHLIRPVCFRRERSEVLKTAAKICGFCVHVYIAIELFKPGAQHFVPVLLPVALVPFS
jgi:hypothetical protein